MARSTSQTSQHGPSAMRVVVRQNSPAEKARHPRAGGPRLSADVLATGFPPTPQHDLRFRGGRTIAQLSYINFFVGGAPSWSQSDVDSINAALSGAMADRRLNNVMRQYFANQDISGTFLGGHFVGTKRPKLVTETSARQLIGALLNGGQLSGIDFPNTIINLMLPKGTVLTDGTGPGRVSRDKDDDRKKSPGAPEREEVSSLHGLGGYHGSVDLAGKRIYYAVGVFSQMLSANRENGIAVFDVAWKNVVATFYHELQEARTDPDVDQAIATNTTNGVIGWNSDAGEECGDFPVFEAGHNPPLIFQEVALEAGGTAPVQFQYSNAVHGPEGPIDAPHALMIPHEIADHG